MFRQWIACNLLDSLGPILLETLRKTNIVLLSAIINSSCNASQLKLAFTIMQCIVGLVSCDYF
jgi:hypothetical protein